MQFADGTPFTGGASPLRSDRRIAMEAATGKRTGAAQENLMTKTMLIDAANSEEIRVCVLQNGKVEDFDFESANRKPLRGNIYLARVTRVEPSLQAAFVEFGGNRHGFLAFNEIHPDYYQVPVSDRRLIQEAEAEEASIAAALNLTDGADGDDRDLDEIAADIGEERSQSFDSHSERNASERSADQPDASAEDESSSGAIDDERDESEEPPHEDGGVSSEDFTDERPSRSTQDEEIVTAGSEDFDGDVVDEDEDENADEDDSDEKAEARRAAKVKSPLEAELAKLSRPQLIERYKDARRKRARLLRNYKIQEVIKRRQILLVQAVKEERGNKGAALTTYLSLAGRYCVLMPNTARGGGISRKIPVAADRKRLRRVVDSLDVPNGMGLIIRTAGAKRTKAEIKRDYDYLIRLWENIRTLTLKSIAPSLIYEEASLIKRAIRDLYDKDIGAVQVEGDNGYREAKDFMKMLMPSHAKNVQPYKEKTPLFLRYGVETQLDAMYRPTVRLKSGGYVVINQTEALIAIDVNSGKSTRERNIEQTALRTNLEAADEVARQCRLRDLAGLIVIDFIDMEEGRNNRAVEKRLKDALRADRARIQLGRISGFGLLELSRQRRRSGIVDGTTHVCPTCGGAGAVRSHEMAALRILRSAENEAISSKAGNLQIKAALDVTLYILNHKRDWLRRIETDYGVMVELTADSAKAGDNFEIEKIGVRPENLMVPEIVRADTTETIEPDVEETELHAADDAPERHDSGVEQADDDQNGARRKRRRRRRRRDGEKDGDAQRPEILVQTSDDGEQPVEERFSTSPDEQPTGEDGDRTKKRRRRGRRGGRRGRRPEGDGASPTSEFAASGENEGDDAELTSEAEHSARQDFIEADAQAVDEDAGADDSRPVQPEAIVAAEPTSPEPAPPVADTVPTTSGEQAMPEHAAEPPKPVRRGWWNRALGG